MLPVQPAQTRNPARRSPRSSKMFDPELDSALVVADPGQGQTVSTLHAEQNTTNKHIQPQLRNSMPGRIHRRPHSSMSHTRMARTKIPIDRRVKLWSLPRRTKPLMRPARALSQSRSPSLSPDTGNEFPSSPFLRCSQDSQQAYFRNLNLGDSSTRLQINQEDCTSSLLSTFSKNSRVQKTSMIWSEPHQELSEHSAANMYRLLNRESKIRFLNFIFDEVCGVPPSEPMKNVLDSESTFRRCDSELLESLEGSSDRNIFRRRAIIWMLMQMTRKEGEGGVWAAYPIDNVRLRRRVEDLESEVAKLNQAALEQENRMKQHREEALSSTSRVIGRLKKRLNDTEALLLEKLAEKKAVDESAAKLSAANEQQRKTLISIGEALAVSQDRLADEQKKATAMRMKILELEQKLRTLTSSPPLYKILSQVRREGM